MKIMVITPYLPHSRVGHGGGTAVRDLVKHLAENHEVLVVSLVRPEESSAIAEVQKLGVEVAPLPFADSKVKGLARLTLMARRSFTGLRSMVSGYPPYVEKYWTRDLSRKILDLASDFRPQAIQIEYLQMSLFGRDLMTWRENHSADSPKIILNTHELGSVPRMRRAARAQTPLGRWWYQREAAQWEHLQVSASQWADRTLCVTSEDLQIFKDMGGENLLTVPLGMDLKSVRPQRQPEVPPVCLFVGSFNHRPNALAAGLLIHHIWPRVRSTRPDASLVLAGRGSRKFLQNEGKTSHFEDLGISAAGFVDDLTPLFRRSALFVAPLPEGGGIKIKILEAMARGIPVVTTPVGAEGITTVEDDAIVINDPEMGFAEAVVQALQDPQTEARALRARALMEKEFGWEAITERLARLYLGQE
jgi:glycosyltransferase involved in cell wall biosynthesis